MKTVLLVDDDLGFAFWLGRLLDGTGFDAWPAKSAADAAVLLQSLSARPDLLIVNLACPGTVPLAEDQRSRGTRIIGLCPDEAARGSAPPQVDEWYGKPRELDSLSKLEWLTRIERLLNSSAAGPARRALEREAME